MKTKYFYLIITFIVSSFVAFSAFNVPDDEQPKTNKDIIKFSHALHAEATDCASCHSNVAGSTNLDDRLLPTKEDCAGCHDVNDESACGTCHYEGVNEPLIIKKSSLYFNHQLHMKDNSATCTDCHSGIDQVDYSFESVSPNPAMAKCSSCHNSSAVASNACQLCHVSTNNLRPADHKTVSFMDTHKFASEKAGANCAMCHDNEFCESCHIATTGIDAANTAKDFYTPYAPHKYIDNSKIQQITRVHDLNYRFSHGIDAKGKSTECQTCHQTETFCAECHSSTGGDYAYEGIVPTSHITQGFMVLGVGSGGGEHAVLAKRDIERCASCHDTQGADPNCVMCHTDADGIKGSNPKTHDKSFMSDSEGDWHDTQASVCYNCHTDVNARPGGTPGIGFCGYCHGGVQ
ncbi:MAG: cytochrome c3 family protein [bacterium]